MEVSSARRAFSYAKGDGAELALAILLSNRGSIVQQHPRNTPRNYADKVDLDIITRSGQHFAIEVKSNKRNVGGHILLEVVGAKGHPGWLCGKADYIAQERESEWWFYPREKALNYLIGKYGQINNGAIRRLSASEEKPIRQWIGRKGANDYGTQQKDVFILIPVAELEALVTLRIKKD
jgi:hypothetical protein